MLQIRLEPRGKGDPWSGMVVNGEPLHDTRAMYLDSGEIYASVYDPDSTLRLLTHTIQELRDRFSYLKLACLSPFPELSLSATFVFDQAPGKPDRLQIEYQVSIPNWRGPWSIAAYNTAIRENLLHHPEISEAGITLASEENVEDGLWSFDCLVSNSDCPGEKELGRWIRITSGPIATAREALRSSIDPVALITLFEFPRHVSTACEQYLLYFVQFLRDLGIEAGASIEHEAHQVLFRVTPQEGGEALDRIREALEIYLRLPDSPGFATQAAAYRDIAVQQLQANIYHLKGQLAVAHAVLQAKNAQVEALELSNFRYQQLLATEQQIATIRQLPGDKSDRDVEPLVPGVIEITKYEGKGFTVNLAEILRRLKRKFD